MAETEISLFKRVISLGLAILLLLIIINFYQGFIKLRAKNAEIKSLEDDIEKISNNKEELVTKLEYLESMEYIEEAARKQLGLVKEGEMLYISIER